MSFASISASQYHSIFILQGFDICSFKWFLLDLKVHDMYFIALLKRFDLRLGQPWVFFGRNDAKAETPVLWPPYVKSWLIGKDSDAGRDWGQEVKGMTEDEMAGWHHRLNGCESEWTPGVGDGTGRPGVLRFMGSQRVGHDWATELNWTEHLSYSNSSRKLQRKVNFQTHSMRPPSP